MSKSETNSGSQESGSSRRERVPLDERRTDVIDAALVEFGNGGFEGASTSAIAKRAGIHQPYIYAMFENKRELFLACNDALNERLLETFRETREPDESPLEQLNSMGASYREILETESWARCHLQVLASAGNPELRQPVREGFERLFAAVKKLTGATRRQVSEFFAANVMATAMDVLGSLSEMADDLPLPGEGSVEATV
jgi:AcrR family transcriptional regulator